MPLPQRPTSSESALPAAPTAGSNDPGYVRGVIRGGGYTSHTSGLLPGRVQGNLVILPEAHAHDFLRYCHRNPRPCPLLAVSEPGDPHLPELGVDIDVRSDVPRYRVWRRGELSAEPTDIGELWREDLVTFVLGCSFSFEQALLEAGIPLRHLEEGRNVPMFRTDIETAPAGRFAGPLVVSMRPLSVSDAIRAVQVCTRFPNVHGAPVHLGDPAEIGIEDLLRPNYGDAIPLQRGELPVFWACGVTPQAVIERAGLDLCITHAPGAMLITDLFNARIATC